IISAGTDQTICNGSSATFNASPGYSYQWTPGNLTSQFITVTPNTTGDYTVKATDSNGCMNWDTVQVVVNPLPVVTAGVSQTVCNGTTVSFTASGANNYT